MACILNLWLKNYVIRGLSGKKEESIGLCPPGWKEAFWPVKKRREGEKELTALSSELAGTGSSIRTRRQLPMPSRQNEKAMEGRPKGTIFIVKKLRMIHYLILSFIAKIWWVLLNNLRYLSISEEIIVWYSLHRSSFWINLYLVRI